VVTSKAVKHIRSFSGNARDACHQCMHHQQQQAVKANEGSTAVRPPFQLFLRTRLDCAAW